MVGPQRNADAVVLDFDHETAVRATQPDVEALRARVLCRVADGLLRDAVGGHLDRGWERRDITSNLETNCRGVWCDRACTDFGVLLKGRQEAPMIEGWWTKALH